MNELSPPEEMYLVASTGNWDWRLTDDPTTAAKEARRRHDMHHKAVRIYKVRVEVLERLELQQEVILEKLVPEGTAVKE